jgi:hypothetical protein
MSKTIRKYDKFQYHTEDLGCLNCLHNKKKSNKHGCGLAACPYDGIRADALANGRIKRKRGWNK